MLFARPSYTHALKNLANLNPMQAARHSRHSKQAKASPTKIVQSTIFNSYIYIYTTNARWTAH